MVCSFLRTFILGLMPSCSHLVFFFLSFEKIYSLNRFCKIFNNIQIRAMSFSIDLGVFYCVF